MTITPDVLSNYVNFLKQRSVFRFSASRCDKCGCTVVKTLVLMMTPTADSQHMQ